MPFPVNFTRFVLCKSGRGENRISTLLGLIAYDPADCGCASPISSVKDSNSLLGTDDISIL